MSSAVCKHCGCADIDDDPSRGNKVCTGCGSVLQESAIVSEINFAETAPGAHSLIGQFVSHEGPTKLSIGGLQGYNGRESREITLNNGKRRIQEVASQLRLNQHCIDMAFNFFKMAVSKGITRGRKSPYVIAACLYITCRLEGTPHLLLDFSDVLRVNIYDLGKTFSFLCRSLYVNVPPTDPCVYVLRFANCLKFGDREHDVVMMALKLVSRMKRDWMAIGRRPTGVCGAALLLAARAHNFNRTIADIVKVVSIGESVLRKRLAEFSATPSSALTLDEFQSVDLEQEADPPCFTEGKLKARLRQEREAAEKAAAAVSEEQLLAEASEIEAAIAASSPRKRSKSGMGAVVPDLTEGVLDTSVEEELAQASSFLSSEVLEIAGLGDTAKKLVRKAKEIKTGNFMDKYRAFAPTLQSLGLSASEEAQNETNEEGQQPTTSTKSREGETEELALDDIDEEEIDAYILNEPEVKMKTFLWMKINGGFMREREEKMKVKQELEEKLKNDPTAKKRKQQKDRKKKAPIQGKTAAEAMEKVIHEKKLSNKINYSVLATLTPAQPNESDSAQPPPPPASPAPLPPKLISTPKKLAIDNPASPPKVTRGQNIFQAQPNESDSAQPPPPPASPAPLPPKLISTPKKLAIDNPAFPPKVTRGQNIFQAQPNESDSAQPPPPPASPAPLPPKLISTPKKLAIDNPAFPPKVTRGQNIFQAQPNESNSAQPPPPPASPAPLPPKLISTPKKLAIDNPAFPPKVTRGQNIFQAQPNESDSAQPPPPPASPAPLPPKLISTPKKLAIDNPAFPPKVTRGQNIFQAQPNESDSAQPPPPPASPAPLPPKLISTPKKLAIDNPASPPEVTRGKRKAVAPKLPGKKSKS